MIQEGYGKALALLGIAGYRTLSVFFLRAYTHFQKNGIPRPHAYDPILLLRERLDDRILSCYPLNRDLAIILC